MLISIPFPIIKKKKRINITKTMFITKRVKKTPFQLLKLIQLNLKSQTLGRKKTKTKLVQIRLYMILVRSSTITTKI